MSQPYPGQPYPAGQPYPGGQAGPIVPGQVPPGYAYGYPGYPPPPPPPVAPGGQRLAEFVDRLLARIIDTVILSAVATVIILPLYLGLLFAVINNAEGQEVTSPNGRTTVELDDPAGFVLQFFGLFALIMVLSLAMSYIYEVEMMYRRGQTIGKRVMKIQVIMLDPAQSLTRWAAVKRWGVQFLCGFVPGLSLLDGLWQLWDRPYRQCLHDKAAATAVIKLNP